MMVLRNPWLFALLCLLCIVTIINAEIAEQLTAQNPCVTKPTCSECIQTKSCAWCMQSEFSDRPRCFQPSLSSSASFCIAKDTWNPSNYKYVDQDLNKQLSISSGHSGGASASGGSSASGGAGAASGASGSIVQIYPQQVQLKLRINQAERVQISYAQAVDYPVDLYYLMDLSKSMEDDKEKLSKLGTLLSQEMQAITSNFRLGFGSFVDKVVMPYVSTVPAKLDQPCDECVAPYGFRNHMALSANSSIFSEEVSSARVSGNLDAPEGGFDAIMQAIVCREAIGWRNQSRKLLVFSTDAGFHYAGDGKLGGIVKPNDGECHLDDGRTYSYSTVQDYPSISQINLKVKNNSINVIFAVTAGQIGIYQKLEKHIEGSSSATLSEDSSNVVELVKTEYSKISSSIEMNDNASKYVKVSYFSRCLNSNGPEIETSKCDGLKVGDTVTFAAEITAKSCPVDRNEWNQKLKIYPIGLTESMVVNIELLCDCPCERSSEQGFELNSGLCSGNGTYSCGICLCNEGFFGRKCECSNKKLSSKNNFTQSCRSPTATKDCSGRGECNCGICECYPRTSPELVWGEHCECDNFSCERRDGKFCSGNGQCKCGTCECDADWSGSACDCKNTTTTCVAPNHVDQNIICSNHGECVCGACVCNKDNDGERHSGKYCERCPSCSGKCDEFRDCVMCQMYKTGPLSPEECANCTAFNVPESAIVVTADEDKGEYLCTYNDENGCRFSYVYSTTLNDTVVVRAQQEPVCPAKVFMLGIVLGVIAAIVLIGLAMILLWKMVTTIHDRREFAKFEKERMMAKWDTGENPIYKQATSTFKNPTYAGK